MQSFECLYASLSTLLQILFAIIFTCISKAVSTISFTSFKPSPIFLFALPHILTYRFKCLLIPSLAFLTIQNCYLFSQTTFIVNNRLVTIFNSIFQTKYSEPLIFLICNIILDIITYLLSKVYKTRRVLIATNICVSVMLVGLLKFDKILLIGFVITKIISFWGYLCDEKEDVMEVFVVVLMNIFFYGLFYILHSGLLICQFNFN